jgi:GNAT superfamily N-acetyltransferase
VHYASCLDEFVLVRTTYLEQCSPDQLRPAREPALPVDIVRVELPSPEFSRFLYATVGGDWYWTDRLEWSREDWLSYLNGPQVETWVAWVRGAPAGYIELAGASNLDRFSVEIAYFGLMPGFLGLGIGGHLLTFGLRQAWSIGSRWPGTPPVERVFVHTCTLDGPAALANYQARGLVIFRTEEAERWVPELPLGSWPR